MGISFGDGIGLTPEPLPNVRWFVVGFQHDGTELTVFDDLRVPASSGQKGLTNPPGFSLFLDDGGLPSTGVFVDWFDDTAEEEMFFSVQLPHAWSEGTTICPHIHWTPHPLSTPALGEVVAWGLEYTWANIGTTFPATTLIGGNTHFPADDPLVVSRHYYTDLGDITAVGKTVSSMLICRVFRDATSSLNPDTFTGPGNHDAGLLEIDFHYEIDSLGSVAETDKLATEPGMRDAPFSVGYLRDDGSAHGDVVTENSIELRFHSFRRLVDEDHPLKATLFFIPARS